jgi:D-alanine-D-alanine ligase
MKVCILLGGASPERNVSIASGKAVGKALESYGHSLFYVDPSMPWDLMSDVQKSLDASSVTDDHFYDMADRDEAFFTDHIREIKAQKADVVFNALHGGTGENGIIAAILEISGIPYTGSGPLASALSMDKYLSKILAGKVNVKTGQVQKITSAEDECIGRLTFPLVLKPNSAGSSVGLFVLKKPCDVKPLIREGLKYDSVLLAEEYIPGQEITVPVIGGKACPLIEIIPDGGVYTFETKYTSGKSRYKVPAPLSEEVTESLQAQALRIWDILGLESYARIDFRLKDGKETYFLEANTLPGMTATSLLPKSAKVMGMDFPHLTDWIIRDALERHEKKEKR